MCEVKIKTTFSHILHTCDWELFCDLEGYNPWMIAEGLASGDEIVEVSVDVAKKLGLI